LEFYESVFGGELALSTYKDGGVPHDPSEADHIMHGQLTGDNGITLMCADTPSGMPVKVGSSISISLSGDDEATLTEYYNKLSAGGTVHEPLTKAPWGDIFGMFADKYGVEWMVNIAGAKAE